MVTRTTAIPKYNTRYFTQIFESDEMFVSECYNSGLLTFKKNNETKYYVNEENLKILYRLLFARHGNDPIQNYDEEQFKYKVYGIIFQYGPTWQKRLELQNEVRALTIEEASSGTLSIYNHAFNDASEIPLSPENNNGELRFVNDQNVSKYKKGKTDTVMQLWEILKVDITDSFLNKFDKLFKTVGDTDPYIFMTYVED